MDKKIGRREKELMEGLGRSKENSWLRQKLSIICGTPIWLQENLVVISF